MTYFSNYFWRFKMWFDTLWIQEEDDEVFKYD